MRKPLIAVIAACAVLLVPSAANAAKSKYAGSIKPSGSISFTVKEKHDEQSVVKLAWKDMPVDCSGDPQTSDGGLSFEVPVKKHKFKARAVLGSGKHPDARAVITGKLKGHNASGKIELSGTKLPTNDGNTGNCASKNLKWKASS